MPVVPWKHHVEHANENAFTNITHVAYRDRVVDRFERVWFPERKSVKEGRELVSVNGERWWHGGERN